MNTYADMRKVAADLFQVGVLAAEPAKTLQPYLIDIEPVQGRNFIVSVGKAAISMAEEALLHLPLETEAIAITNYENSREINRCRVMSAGHPLPDNNGALASQAVIEMLQNTTSHDRVIVLLSGGGSALLPAPVDGVTLNDKISVSDLMLGAGCNITEMNLVRQQLSKLKGGGLADFAHPAKVESYILSDVIGDDLRAIASGPTASRLGNNTKAKDILNHFGIYDRIPESIKQHLSQPDQDGRKCSAKNTLIGSNRQSLEAIAATSDQITLISDTLKGDVSEAASYIYQAAQKRKSPIMLFGGETTVKVMGQGKGGRNQELALRFARMAQNMGEWVFLSAGTDGRDGPTDAAGGLVDNTTITRAEAAGIDVVQSLAQNDSYHALKACEDLFITGPTGTNVADIQILIMR